MANHKEEVPLFENPGLLLWDLVSTTWAGQVSYLPLTEGAGGICAPGDVQILQAIQSLLCERVTCSHPFQQALPPEVREIRPGCTRRIAKMLDDIAWAHAPLFSNQKKGLMLICLHFWTDLGPRRASSLLAFASLSRTAHLAVILLLPSGNCVA